jgi:hypothetical protein
MVTLKDEAPKTSCPFTFHAQIHSVGVLEYLMQELEDELQNPTGISTVSAPKLSVSNILLSRECGILYEVTNSEGLRCASCPQKLLLMILKTATAATGHTFFRKVTTCACHFKFVFSSESSSLSPCYRCWSNGNLLPYSFDSLLSTN